MFDYTKPVADICLPSRTRANARQAQLTKPLGSLGDLEDIAIQFAGWQGCEKPSLDNPENIALRVFAGDHGVCAQGVSAFPQEVTQQMIYNFCSGGAAVSVLAAQQGFGFEVWNMGTASPLANIEDSAAMPMSNPLVDRQIAAGTADFSQHAAMTESQLVSAMAAGAESVPEDAALFIGGEMGIGNTTSASALMAALYKLDAESVTGRGTGVDDQGLQRKIAVIEQAITRHTADQPTSVQLLQRLGGLEIAALVGAYVSAAQKGIPILVDGFITSVAAAYAVSLNPGTRYWMLFGHCSAEHAHRDLLNRMNANPILQLGMRLGEASGAASAVPIIRLALSLHEHMATFADAGVSESEVEDC